MSFAVALLAGGKSSRMGTDKAFLEEGGRPLWEVQAEKLEALGAETQLLLVRGNQEMERAGWTRVEDPPDLDQGPMGALVRALRSAEGKPVLLLAVDLPRIPLDFLRQLAAQPEKGLIPKTEAGFQPVSALWPADALWHAEQALQEKKLSLQTLALEGLVEGWMASFECGDEFLNVNTPEEADAILSERATPLLLEHYSGEQQEIRSDLVAREEPLQIRVDGADVAVLMRTPGDDRELVAGFLLSEGVVSHRTDLFEVSECPSAQDEGGQVVDVILGPKATFDPEKLSRHVFATSSCGVCGKATIDSVLQELKPLKSYGPASAGYIRSLPGKLAEAQETFHRTGGLHACALFDRFGNLVAIREDVGRHNALDKLLGWALFEMRLPLEDMVLLLSGRVSLEMMQKALVGRVETVAAISAPTSLAVDYAKDSGQTLVGFLRGERLNLYAGSLRP